MINYGIIKPASSGMYSLLPLGMRVLNKLTSIVDKEMTNIDAEKIMLPALTSTKLWKKSDRYDSTKSELFTVTDRHDKEYVLSPVSKKFSVAYCLDHGCFKWKCFEKKYIFFIVVMTYDP